MAESSGNKGLGQAPEQMSTETRLLLAFLLMGAIMFLTPYFFKSQAPPPNAKKSTQATAESTVPPTPGEAKAPTVSAESKLAPSAPVAQAEAQTQFTINT